MQMCGCDGNVDGVKLFLVRKVILTKAEGGIDRKQFLSSLMKGRHILESQSFDIYLDMLSTYSLRNKSQKERIKKHLDHIFCA